MGYSCDRVEPGAKDPREPLRVFKRIERAAPAGVNQRSLQPIRGIRRGRICSINSSVFVESIASENTGKNAEGVIALEQAV